MVKSGRKLISPGVDCVDAGAAKEGAWVDTVVNDGIRWNFLAECRASMEFVEWVVVVVVNGVPGWIDVRNLGSIDPCGAVPRLFPEWNLKSCVIMYMYTCKS